MAVDKTLAVTPFNVADSFQNLSVDEIRAEQQLRSWPMHVAMYNVVRDFNLASCIRNAMAFGASTFHIIGWRKFDKRGTVGAHNYVPLAFHPDADHFFDWCILNRAPVVALEQADNSRGNWSYLSDFQWPYNAMILIGEEQRGIPCEDLDRAAHVVTIQQYGVARSLNAATASGIAMNSCTDFYARSIAENKSPLISST